ncbi:helix-turn-helix domain-containing protein [Paenibacillus ginsengarvi]|uniref:AraC family transcriptional regulator n=1 Tax=Paenibacillus ginsengarvi TaxID=400777 RepID=A0A3B0C3P4_9BACL|nr:AraC family transcriptional regulator [Paenibacillus ginsengarvi]RKN79128.1 AraC family transcriptional regulator [Paenibacillus ginsengarvi]
MLESAFEYYEAWRNVPGPLETTAGMWLVRAGHNIAKPSYLSGPKIIESYSLHFIVQGKVRLEYGGETVVLAKHNLFCLWPNVSYSYRIEPSASPLRMMWLVLDGPQLPALLERIGIGPGQPFSTASPFDASARAIVNNIHRTLHMPHGDPLARQLLLYMLFDRLAKKTSRPPEPDRHNGDWVNQALAYFRLHYTEPLSIGEAARLAGVHRSHFTAMFQRETGESPQQFVLRLRMEKATALLKEGALSVGEIALSVGYADLYSFSRAYKKYAGHPPSDLRKNGGRLALESGGE